MLEYGLSSRDIPLFLGQEKLMLLERVIRHADITDKAGASGGSYYGGVYTDYTVHRRILLGSAENTYVVFADYKQVDPNIFMSWDALRNAGRGSIKFNYLSGITDNSLILDNGNWYLLVFSDGRKVDIDFYVYKAENTGIQSQNYGLNVYRPDGSLAYHSGWNILRARHVLHELPPVRNDIQDIPILGQRNDQLLNLQASKGKVFVGGDKLVSIGYAAQVDKIVYDSPRGFGYGVHPIRFAPFLKNGGLGYSLAFLCSGEEDPLSVANTFYAESLFTTGNPIIVIDKPNI